MSDFYQEQDGKFWPVQSLWTALDLKDISHAVISLVGAGGKTSTMYQLARECREMGKRVIVTTSTHIACPGEYPVMVIRKASELEPMREAGTMPGILVAAGEMIGERQKLVGMPVSELRKLSAYCDVLLIEADGSRRLPLKLCADHEPVICEGIQVVIGCVGMSALGKPWKDACFRWELADAAWSRGVVRSDQVAQVLEDREHGTRKRVGDREYRIVLNQLDDEERRAEAEGIVRCLRQAGSRTVIAASAYR